MNEVEKAPVELLTAREVAAVLRCCAKTVFRLAERGELRPIHVGHLRRWSRRDVQCFIDGTAAPQTEAR